MLDPIENTFREDPILSIFVQRTKKFEARPSASSENMKHQIIFRLILKMGLYTINTLGGNLMWCPFLFEVL